MGAVFFALLSVFEIAIHRGTPAYLHDWMWPAGVDQCAAYAFSGLQGWRVVGSGSPSVFPEAWLPYLASGTACAIVGPKAALIAIITVYYVAAAFGIAAAARILGLSAAGRAAAIVLYLGNPVLLNEMHAGHLLFLFSYAGMPWIVAIASGPAFRARAVVLGVVIGLAAAQQQFLLFGLVLAAAFLRSKSYAREGATAFIAALLTASPQWVQIFVNGQRSLQAYIPLHHWEDIQSDAPAYSLRLLGYIGSYDRLLPGPVRDALWAIPVFSVAGLVFFKNRGAALRLLAIAAAAIAAMNGTHWPTTGAAGWLFSHVSAAALYRELYDFSALPMFAFALLTGAFVSGLARVRTWQYAALTVVAALALPCAALASKDVPTFSTSFSYAIPRDAYRVAISPGFYPLSLGARNGVGPEVLGIQGHPLANEPPPLTWPAAYLSALIDSGRTAAAQRLAARIGVSCILSFDGAREVFGQVVEPMMHPIPFATAKGLGESRCFDGAQRVVLRRPAAEAIADIASSYGGALAGPDEPDVHALPPQRTYESSPDPFRGWVPLAIWPSLAHWLYEQPLAYFTMLRNDALASPPGTLLVGSQKGDAHGSGCITKAKVDTHWQLLSCGANPEISGTPPLAVSGLITQFRTQPDQAVPPLAGSVAAGPQTDSFILARVDAPAGSMLVLREGFDRLWQISIPGSHHVLADRYANGWILEKRYNGTVLIWYAGTAVRGLALAVSFLLVVFAAAVGLRLRSNRAGHGQ